MAADAVLDRPEQFPAFEVQVAALVADHKELDEGLRLAVYYQPDREGYEDDIFLFEVPRDYDGDAGLGEGDLLEIWYGPTMHFPMGKYQKLHIVLANADEIKQGLKHGSRIVSELRLAFAAGKARVVYVADDSTDLVDLIRG